MFLPKLKATISHSSGAFDISSAYVAFIPPVWLRKPLGFPPVKRARVRCQWSAMGSIAQPLVPSPHSLVPILSFLPQYKGRPHEIRIAAEIKRLPLLLMPDAFFYPDPDNSLSHSHPTT